MVESITVHAALASAPRQRVLLALRSAAEPMDAAEIARAVGCHVTTVRGHLRTLADAGIVQVRTLRTSRRGRPAFEYSLSEPSRDEDPRDQLIEILAGAIDARAPGAAADADRGHLPAPDLFADPAELGRSWAAQLAPLPPEDAVGELVRLIDRLGFQPEMNRPRRASRTRSAAAVSGQTPSGDEDREIRLRACPFLGAARAHPGVVCGIHRGMIQRLLEPTQLRAELHPFTEPSVCVVALRDEGAASLSARAG